MRKNIIACGLVVLAAFATYAQSKKGGDPAAPDDCRNRQL